MAAQSPQLTAKFSRPHLPSDVIYRQRLLDLLQAGAEQPLILVSAPPGYGKSTQVNLWLSTLDAACAWLSLDEYDDTLQSFVAYLWAAVATAVPDIGRAADVAVEAPVPPAPEQLADIFLHDLGMIDTPFYLVLDDYHSVQSSEIQRFMERVIERLPPHVHIVLIVRSDPPLRLARLRGRRQLVEVRGVHLRFSEDEAKAFIEHFLGSALSPAIVALLTERTEGWPAGLQLAAISLRDQIDQAAFATAFAKSSNQLVGEYLVSEVLQGMPPDQREFLLRCSILDRFCAPLCDAVINSNAEQRCAQQFLETCQQRNLFLIALDGEGRWFRFHHLFRSLLKHHLELTHTAAEIAELHARAGRWFAAQGEVGVALRHSLVAGDDLYAACLVERNVHAALNRETWRELEHWLALLPDAAKQRPALLVAQAWLEHFRYRFATIPALLQMAQHNLALAPSATPAEQADNAELMGNIHALRAHAALNGGAPAEALQASTLALELLPSHLLYARGIAEHHQVRAIMQSGDLGGAVHEAQQLLAQDAQPDARTLRLLLALCAMYYDCAEFAALESTASMYRRVAQQLQRPLSVAWANVCLGWACYHRGDLENARTCFTSVVEAPYAAHIRAVMESFMGLALVLCAENQRKQAHATVDRLAAWLAAAGLAGQLTFVDALATYIDLAFGVTPAQPFAMPEGASFSGIEVSVMPALVRARVYLQNGTGGDLARAEAILAKCRVLAAARNLQRRLIEIDALNALCCAELGQHEEALTLLAQSVTRAASSGALRTLLDLGPELRPLLQELLARNVAAAFVSRLLAAYPPPAEPAHAPLPANPPDADVVRAADMLLTNRELDVLLLLAERLTDKEIANILFLSPRTVKKHSSSIYQKLDVDNRRAAVSQARAMGILPVA